MSKRTRALIIILLFVILSAALVGCGRKGDPAAPAGAAEAAEAD